VGQVDDVLDALLFGDLREDDRGLHQTFGNGKAEIGAIDARHNPPHIAQARDIPRRRSRRPDWRGLANERPPDGQGRGL
jgi:hypothetical protein